MDPLPIAPAEPLARHALLRTADIDEAREQVARLFVPHQIHTAPRAREFLAVQNHVSLGGLAFNYIGYGPEVIIEAAPFDRFYTLQIPLAGRCRIISGDQEADIGRGDIAVVNPTGAVRLEWRGGCRQLVLRIDKALFESCLAERLGAATAPAFHLRQRPDAARGAGLLRLIAMMCRELDEEQPLIAAPLAQAAAERLLAGAVLETLSHSHSQTLDQRSRGAVPFYVRRVTAYIEANRHLPITLANLVAIAGASERSLFGGFRAHHGMGPMAFLKARRLDAARAALAAPDGHRPTVTGIATASGFNHLSNFARDYRDRFGESPRQTLHRHRT